MIISIETIIIVVVLLIVTVATPFCSPFSRKVEEEEVHHEEKQVNMPPVSIVLTDHDSAYHLEQVLPSLLSQDYPTDYQVVVVIDKSDSESEDVLKRHGDNSRLYYTFLPDTSRYLSRKKLGLTLGIRAAKHDWVVVTDVHSKPTSDKWLTALASHASDDRNMVLGTVLYTDESPAYYRFEQLRTALYHLRKAQRGMAFSTNMPLVMMRKSEFFEQNGFRGNLEYTRAEFEFLVNKFAKEGQCGIAIEPEARMEAMTPSTKRWRMSRLFALDALSGMERVWSFRSMFSMDMWARHISKLCVLLTILYGLYLMPALDGMVLLASAVVLWLVGVGVRCHIYKHALEYFDGVGAMKAVLLESTMALRNFALRIRYRLSDKNDFITHKL